MVGWIKIDRNIRNHWIWSDPIKFQWWFDIIMTVNYEDKKVPIGYKLFLCKRGESLMSYNEWAKRWKVSKSVVYNFFTMLKNDEMISIKNETVTIRLTVCNYDSYQDNQNGNKTDEERIENASRTHRERKAYTTKEREEKKELEERKEEDINIVSSETKTNNEAFEKFNKWLDSETTFVRKIKKQITEEQFIKLKKTYNSTQIMKTILNLENYKEATKRYTSVYLTVKNWLDKDNNRLNK